MRKGFLWGWVGISLRIKKSNRSVLNSGTNTDLYQNASLRLIQTTGSDSMDVALNVGLSSGAKGSYEGFSGSADFKANYGLKTHYATTDDVLVANASVVNGASYVVPSGSFSDVASPLVQRAPAGQVHLTSQVEELLEKDPEAFRDLCGDGFVTSIVSGADLYFVLHFSNLDHSTRVQLDTTIKASGGFGDAFSATGEATLASVIESAQKKSQLDVEFLQTGGYITSIPTDFASAKAKVAALATEAKDHARPMFIVLIPYGDLSTRYRYSVLYTTSLRERAVRFYQRLSDVHAEALAIRDDYYKAAPEIPGPVKDSRYFYWYRHGLRANDDFNSVAEEVRTMMLKVADLIQAFNSARL